MLFDQDNIDKPTIDNVLSLVEIFKNIRSGFWYKSPIDYEVHVNYENIEKLSVVMFFYPLIFIIKKRSVQTVV